MGYTQLHRQIMNNRIVNALRDIPAMGNIYYVFEASDTYGTAFKGLVNQTYADGSQAFQTSLAAAYAACTSDRNDVILLDAHATHSLAAGIAWTKNRIHVVGMDGGDRLVQHGAKIELATAATTAYVVSVTGLRNSFRNVKFINSGTAATCLHVVEMGGEGNLYLNCSMVFGVVNNLGLTTAHEVVTGEDSGTCIDCTFGSDTLLTSAARSVFHIKSLSGWEFKSNRLRGCAFIISSSSATATFVRLDTINDILFTNLFEDCSFQASIDSAGGIALTAGAIQTGTSTVKGTINLSYPAVFNCGVSLAASGNNTNVQVVAPASVTTAIKGIQPTA